MEIEKQVCSLELAKRLKELGVKQDSYFNWVTNGEGWLITHRQAFQVGCAAFTVAELGEMLPQCVYSYRAADNIWDIDYKNFIVPGRKANETEADKRAKMLIYLIEQGQVTL